MSESIDSQQNNEQLLNDIQSLQTMEQEIFNSLETNPNLSTDQKEKMVEKMNQLSNMRINLYQTLSGVNNYYQNALSSSQGTLTEQSAAISIVENELNTAKKRLQFLEAEKNNKIRLVEINDYYGDKYAEHGALMKIVIFTLVPIIILAILNSKGILPTTIYLILLSIIAAIGGYFFWVRFGSIITRDNMNYQEYDWYFNAGAAPTADSSDDTDPWASSKIMGTCVGDACCSDGQTYDEDLNQCIGTSTVDTTSSDTTSSDTTTTTSNTNKNNGNSKTKTTESFINNVLIKGSDKFKTDFTMNGDERVQPSMSKSFINF
jgi:hypothetical protein